MTNNYVNKVINVNGKEVTILGIDVYDGRQGETAGAKDLDNVELQFNLLINNKNHTLFIGNDEGYAKPAEDRDDNFNFFKGVGGDIEKVEDENERRAIYTLDISEIINIANEYFKDIIAQPVNKNIANEEERVKVKWTFGIALGGTTVECNGDGYLRVNTNSPNKYHAELKYIITEEMNKEMDLINEKYNQDSECLAAVLEMLDTVNEECEVGFS